MNGMDYWLALKCPNLNTVDVKTVNNRILFLDIDGILNTGISKKTFAKEFVDRINRITDTTGANIVISSNWRRYFKLNTLKALLRRNGIKAPIIGYTPIFKNTNTYEVLMGHKRGTEIQAWLDAQDVKPKSIVILDDISDMLHLTPYLVLTDTYKGITDDDADLAIEILKTQTL